MKHMLRLTKRLSCARGRALSSSLYAPSFVENVLRQNGDHTAIRYGTSTTDGAVLAMSYDQLRARAAAIAAALPQSSRRAHQDCVAILAEPGPDFAAAFLATIMSRRVAVPLCVSHPPQELAYFLEDSRCSIILTSERMRELGANVAKESQAKHLCVGRDTDAAGSDDTPPDVPAQLKPDDAALIIYTSGTTSGRGKGVIHTHASLSAQTNVLMKAWEWTSADRILHPLPLHHVHGLVNCMCCPLSAGAEIEFSQFDPLRIWNRLADRQQPPISVFMAVPTMYVKLIRAFEESSEGQQGLFSSAASKLRLMVSGSAALPSSVFRRWHEISSHELLERYGMTEIGMALSNPLHGERRPGTVGTPLPGVEAKIVDDSGDVVSAGSSGELWIRGPSVFREYLGRPDATAEAFSDDGYFKTGDEAQEDDGSFRILGRRSMDIIKSGGYKLSALEIERVLLEHPQLDEVAVVGVEDEEFGERVAAVAVWKGDAPSLDELRAWGKERMASYKVPTVLRSVDVIPRNTMGKVNKKELKKIMFQNRNAGS